MPAMQCHKSIIWCVFLLYNYDVIFFKNLTFFYLSFTPKKKGVYSHWFDVCVCVCMHFHLQFKMKKFSIEHFTWIFIYFLMNTNVIESELISLSFYSYIIYISLLYHINWKNFFHTYTRTLRIYKRRISIMAN